MNYLKFFFILLILLTYISCDKSVDPKEENRPPVIVSISSNPITSATDRLPGGSAVQITVVATDPDDDQLSYTWHVSEGQFDGDIDKASVTWIAPMSETDKNYEITVTVSDGIESVQAGIVIYVDITTVPVIFTSDITEISETSATGGGDVTDDGGSSVTARGVVWSTSENPTLEDHKTTDGTGTGSFTSTITGLMPGMTYYVKAYATNIAGTAYGEQIKFSTIGFTISGTITEQGEGLNYVTVAASEGHSQTVTADTDGKYTFTNVPYGATVRITPSREGFSFNPEFRSVPSVMQHTTGIDFSAYQTGTVEDIDGNIYKTVKIGDQWWMAENLKTTRYRNGIVIPHAGADSVWESYSQDNIGAWTVYENDDTYDEVYGKLYNWHAVGEQLCPVGWHVPNDDEWTVLQEYLEGEAIAGGKMKSTRTEPDPHPRWDSPNIGATNESGFNGLPGGRRHHTYSFGELGRYGNWWSTTGYGGIHGRMVYLRYGSIELTRSYRFRGVGLSVRCVMD